MVLGWSQGILMLSQVATKNIGVRPFVSSSNDHFYQVRLNYGLTNIRFSRNPFTWCSGQKGYCQIKERLDKLVVNGEWMILFPHPVIQHLPREASDHAQIILYTCGKLPKGPKPFCFKNFWLRDESSWNVINSAWNQQQSGSSAHKLIQKIKATKNALRTWNRESFSHIATKLPNLCTQLDSIQ